jgi:hypothetical protein
MDTATQRKWDAASRNFDVFSYGDDLRLGPHKQRLFAKMRGETLMLAAGTGNDFRFFPPGLSIIAIDISAKMLERAQESGRLSGTHRSSPDGCMPTGIPRQYLRYHFDRLYVLLRAQAGRRSARAVQGIETVRPDFDVRACAEPDWPGRRVSRLDDTTLETPRSRSQSRYRGKRAEGGFRIRREENVYLDIIKAIEGVKDPVLSP